MPQLYHYHLMPVLRPYGERNAHLGKMSPPSRSATENFDFRFCDVAKFIIEKLQDGAETLRFRNGKPTHLFLHAVDCERCNGANIHNAGTISDPRITHGYIKIELAILKDFGKWIRKNHPEGTESTAISLMMKYFDYAYNTMRPELIAYKNKYGELKK